MHEGAGLKTSDPAYRRGLRFLLNSQQPDGSWRVTSRLHPPAPVSPPYVDTEFPEGHDQFISVMGTSWAVNALLQSLPAQAGRKSQPSVDVAPAVQHEWVRVALSGSAAELKKLLDRKMSPNAKTAAGTTALMFAARDPEKVKMLLSHVLEKLMAGGADSKAKNKQGHTALDLARSYNHAKAVSLLTGKIANKI